MENEPILELKPKFGFFTLAFENEYPYRFLILWILCDKIINIPLEWAQNRYVNLFEFILEKFPNISSFLFVLTGILVIILMLAILFIVTTAITNFIFKLLFKITYRVYSDYIEIDVSGKIKKLDFKDVEDVIHTKNFIQKKQKNIGTIKFINNSFALIDVENPAFVYAKIKELMNMQKE